MSLTQWFLNNSIVLLGAAVGLYLLTANKLPSIASWQGFLNSFESKGGQLMLLWVTDLIFVEVLIHHWGSFDSTLQTTIVGILSGVNGAFLGAIGARNTGGGGGNPPAQPTQLAAFVTPKKEG